MFKNEHYVKDIDKVNGLESEHFVTGEVPPTIGITSNKRK